MEKYETLKWPKRYNGNCSKSNDVNISLFWAINEHVNSTHLETKSVKMSGGIDLLNMSCKTDSETFEMVFLFQLVMLSF